MIKLFVWTLLLPTDDSSVPPVGPTSHPPDDPTDGEQSSFPIKLHKSYVQVRTSSRSRHILTDVSGPIFPTEDFSKTEPEDLEASPVPEISSDYELSTVDPLGEISTEATPTAARTPSDNDDLVSTTAEAPSDSTSMWDICLWYLIHTVFVSYFSNRVQKKTSNVATKIQIATKICKLIFNYFIKLIKRLDLQWYDFLSAHSSSWPHFQRANINFSTLSRA